MGRRYVPEDMIRASDFKEMFARMSETKKARAGAAVDHGVELMLSDHPIGMRMPFDFSRKKCYDLYAACGFQRKSNCGLRISLCVHDACHSGTS